MGKRIGADRASWHLMQLEERFVALELDMKEAVADLARSYPKGTEAARRELLSRGYDATEWRMELFCRVRANGGRPVAVANGNRAWQPEDIDELADALEADGKFVEWAMRARDAGKCFMVWHREGQQFSDTAESDLAADVGCPVETFRAALYFCGLDLRIGKKRYFTNRPDISPAWEFWTRAEVDKARVAIAEMQKERDFREEVTRYQRMAERQAQFRAMAVLGCVGPAKK